MGVRGAGGKKVWTQHRPLSGEPHIYSKDNVTAPSTSSFKLVEKLGVSGEISAGVGGLWRNSSRISN